MKERNARNVGDRTSHVRLGLGHESIARDFSEQLLFTQGQLPQVATSNDHYMALAHTVRDRLMEQLVRSLEDMVATDFRAVAYLSAEFLPGPHLENAMLCLGIREAVAEAMASLDLDLETLLAQEHEPGLGNGGLGRLAACFLDSLATLRIPAIGYGIRYEYGLFRQEIAGGWQVEKADKWLRLGNPWEISRPEIEFDVGFGGRTELFHDDGGRLRARWLPNQIIRGQAYDTPIPGYRSEMTIVLRLWAAESPEEFDFSAFSEGDYMGAVTDKIASETLSKVLYPNDEPLAGRRLRLMQQYFFSSCSLQDMLRIHDFKGRPPEEFHRTFAIQLNDTHPAISVAELMRILLDDHGLGWEAAWETTTRTFSYTNHTLLPEALEKWPLALFGEVLPRHLEIILEINHRFMESVRGMGVDEEAIARLSLIDEHGERYVRMANLACVGSSHVNGVAALHTELLKQSVLRDFHDLWPGRIGNKTNGVTPRRWMALCNPEMERLLDEALGPDWPMDIQASLPRLEPLADDPAFVERWRAMRRARKATLIRRLGELGQGIDPESLFDVQVKRIHEYKRQHLNVLHILGRYLRIVNGQGGDLPPRTFVFAGKAAPSYFMAKLIIKLIHCAARLVREDSRTRDLLRVVFVPNFNVSTGQLIYPAADLSEQISTAGKEASGTGNMKFALNGALTIGTLDGANVEIREAAGQENFFLFGLDVQEVSQLRARGYDPAGYAKDDPVLRAVMELLRSPALTGGDADLFRPLADHLWSRDDYLLLADFGPYVTAQDDVDARWLDGRQWWRGSIQTVARCGRFSSDRTIREYCTDIWAAKPLGR